MVVSLLVPNQMRYQAALRPDAIVMSNNTGLFNSRKENKMIQIGNFSYSRWELIGRFVAVKIPRLFSRFCLGVLFGGSMGVLPNNLSHARRVSFFLSKNSGKITTNRK